MRKQCQQRKGTAADHTIRAVDVFCAIKPQRKVLLLFKTKNDAFRTN